MAPTAAQLPMTGRTGSTQANDTYTINNNYVYPRYTTPPILEANSFGSNGLTYLNNPYLNIGLLRGWIYPVDVDRAAHTAVTDADPATTLTAAETARQEAVAAYVTSRTQEGAAAAGAAALIPLAPVGPGETGVPSQSPDPISTPTKIRYHQGKQFQFNPSFVELQIGMIASNPTETEQTEGTASGYMVGQATTSVELYFDRTIEVAAASGGRTSINSGYTIDPIFADIGVQKDLWDIYRMILGGSEDYYQGIGGETVNIDSLTGMHLQPGSGTEMFNRLFDLGLSGSKAWGRRIAVYYNPNLVIIGEVTSIGFIYAEFNANYVPTKAKMDIGLMVMSTTSESGTDAFNETDEDTETETETSDDETASSSSSSSDDSTPVYTGRRGETTYHVTGSGANYAV